MAAIQLSGLSKHYGPLRAVDGVDLSIADAEFLVLAGTFTVNQTVAIVATAGIILAASYVLWMVQRTTQGAPNEEMGRVEGMRRDLTLRESVVVAPLVALLVVLGFYPKPLLDVISPAIAATMADVGASDPAPTSPGPASATSNDVQEGGK